MAASIGDWYENAEGLRGGGLRFDPENDDPADRGPDAWLDDLHAPASPDHRRVPRARSAPSCSDNRDRPGEGRARGRVTAGAPSAKLSTAVSAVRARDPRITLEAMTRLLRKELALPSLTPEKVAEVLAQQEGPILAADARAVMARQPGIQPKKIAAHLRRQRWPEATAAMVQTALRLYPAPASSPRAEPTRASVPRGSTEVQGRYPTTGREARVREIIADQRGRDDCPEPFQLLITMVVFTRESAFANPARLLVLLRRCGMSGLTQAHADRLATPALASSYRTLAGVDSGRTMITAAVRAVRVAAPGISVPKIVLRLHEWGWPQLTAAQVVHAIGRLRTPKVELPPRQAGKRAKPVRTVPQAPTTAAKPLVPDQRRTLDIAERSNADVCPGCGRIVSSLGICGCS